MPSHRSRSQVHFTWLTASPDKDPRRAVKSPLHRTGCPSRRPGAWTLGLEVGSASSLEMKF